MNLGILSLMAIYIKNIILYDSLGAVVGFIEIRPLAEQTRFRVKHSLEQSGLMLSLVIDGVNKVLQITGPNSEFDLPGEVDLDYEIFACIVKQVGAEMVSLASGAINLNKLKQRDAIQEIDHAIKNICSVDEHGNGECNHCPYRDYFFTQAQ